jgi:hypothetical protein
MRDMPTPDAHDAHLAQHETKVGDGAAVDHAVVSEAAALLPEGLQRLRRTSATQEEETSCPYRSAAALATLECELALGHRVVQSLLVQVGESVLEQLAVDVLVVVVAQ